MTSKLWTALNSVDEQLIFLDGIKQHLNFAVDTDASKSELETAICFVVRLLDRFEDDLSNTLSDAWKAYREEKGISELTTSKPPTSSIQVDYTDIINSKLL